MEFRISSALKDLIGRELISNDLIAIFELVKNSYDAGATVVKVKFENVYSEKPIIKIIDNGSGMSKEDIQNKWLFVGFSDKRFSEEELVNFRNKYKNKRFFAGAKGIGRFSCDRLGSKLVLFSKTSKGKKYNCVKVDWKKFEKDQKQEFQKISVDFNELNNLKDVENFEQGTLITISELNSTWDRSKFIQLKRHLQRLINPTNNLKKTDDSFSIELSVSEEEKNDAKEIQKGKTDLYVVNGPITNVVFENLGLKTTSIHVEIDENGENVIYYLKDAEHDIYKLVEKNSFASHLRNMNVTVYFLNRVAKATFTRIMGLEPVNYGSIFAFKNGFRIQPYGDPEDDWLSLNERKNQGIRRYLGTREIIGFVEINGYQKEFREVTSRDGGLVKNESFYSLKEFIITKVLRKLEKYIVDAINWDSESSDADSNTKRDKTLELIKKLTSDSDSINVEFNNDLLKVYKDKEVAQIEEKIKNLEHVAKNLSDPTKKEVISEQVIALRKAFKLKEKKEKKESKEISQELKQKKKEIEYYRDHNPAGLDFKNLAHTIGIASFNIDESLKYILKSIETNDLNTLKRQVNKISMNNEKIKNIIQIINRTSINFQHNVIRGDIVSYISQYIDNISKIDNKKIEISHENDDILHMCKFNPLETSILIDNFINNAQKAKASKIHFEFFKQKKLLSIRVMDNGVGISKRDESRIFEIGFSTTRGAGLGMNHIRTIVENMGGELKFLQNSYKKSYKGACFEVGVSE